MSYVATIVVPLLRQVDDWLDHSVRSALAQSVATEVIVVRSEWTPASNLRVLDRLARSLDTVRGPRRADRLSCSSGEPERLGYPPRNVNRPGVILRAVPAASLVRRSFHLASTRAE